MVTRWLQWSTKVFKNFRLYTGEMAQWQRALVALEKDSGLVPSTHMIAHNDPIIGDLTHLS